jgi:DNA (cytosine-5)-methyltransferase 1
MPAKRNRYFVDLFAGCGGLSLGLEQAGWTPVLVNELNRDAMETYLINRDREFPHLRESKLHVDDIKKLVADGGAALKALKSELRRRFKLNFRRGELDLVVGGPPCQGFSGIGHRRSYSVHKKQLPSNYLYEDMAYVVKTLRPKMFLFENVRGLLHAKWGPRGTNGEIWQAIREKFSEIGEYQIGWRLVYAKDYGVPQNRPRVLMVGVREDSGLKMTDTSEAGLASGLIPAKHGTPPNLQDLLGDLVKDPFVNGERVTVYPRGPETAIQKALRRGSRVPTDHEYSKHSPAIVKKFTFMHEHDGEIPANMQTKKFAQRVLPPVWDPEPTITACSLPDDYVHYSQPRSLTVREWARLQLFPDRYLFAGKRTTGGLRRAGNPRTGLFERELPKYTQIGNAVPVGLAKALGQHFQLLLQD